MNKGGGFGRDCGSFRKPELLTGNNASKPLRLAGSAPNYCCRCERTAARPSHPTTIQVGSLKPDRSRPVNRRWSHSNLRFLPQVGAIHTGQQNQQSVRSRTAAT